jgi:hypothetical protein
LDVRRLHLIPVARENFHVAKRQSSARNNLHRRVELSELLLIKSPAAPGAQIALHIKIELRA